MPSTYSTSLKLELIANGEQSGTWGATTNNNLGTLIEQAITGVGSLALVGDTTLTNYNGLLDESRNAVLVFSGSLLAPANVIAPSVQKTYIVTNNSGANVTVKTATGNGVTIQNGLSSLIYCDGTEFYTAVNVNNVIGDLSVSGNETVGGALTVGGNITLANTVTGTSGNLTLTSNSSVIDMSTNTGAFIPPTGSSGNRPGTPVVGMSRWNTDLGVYEIYNGITWQIIASGSYSITYLIVAGGGGGGSPNFSGSGGGGAGGLITSTTTLTTGTTYVITVGSGGGVSVNGSNSSVSGIGTAVGGGHGGISGTAGGVGASGGSGGGGDSFSVSAGGAGTVGQGNNGSGAVGNYNGGGGGGAGAAGSGTSGGAGASSSITGSTVYYAGGGGGGTRGSGATGTGGIGGGGQNGTGGTANSGGGGAGGGTDPGAYSPTNGGSGVVILSVPTVSYSGATTGSPTVSTSGAYTILTYTSSGTYTA